jgi:hypothetical protein
MWQGWFRNNKHDLEQLLQRLSEDHQTDIARLLLQAYRRVAAEIPASVGDHLLGRGALPASVVDALREELQRAADQIVKKFALPAAQEWCAALKLPPAQSLLRLLADQYGRLVTNLTEEQRTVIGALVANATLFSPVPTGELATQLVRAGLGLSPQGVGWLLNFARGLRDQGSPTAVPFRAIVQRAQELIQARALAIARTEMASSVNRAALESVRQAVRDGKAPDGVLKEWIAAANSCETCQELDGVRVELDAPFPGGYLAPPEPHPNCGCVLGFSVRTA